MLDAENSSILLPEQKSRFSLSIPAKKRKKFRDEKTIKIKKRFDDEKEFDLFVNCMNWVDDYPDIKNHFSQGAYDFQVILVSNLRNLIFVKNKNNKVFIYTLNDFKRFKKLNPKIGEIVGVCQASDLIVFAGKNGYIREYDLQTYSFIGPAQKTALYQINRTHISLGKTSDKKELVFYLIYGLEKGKEGEQTCAQDLFPKVIANLK